MFFHITINFKLHINPFSTLNLHDHLNIIYIIKIANKISQYIHFWLGDKEPKKFTLISTYEIFNTFYFILFFPI